MKRTIDVFLGGSARSLGVLRFDAQGSRFSAGFEYHPGWGCAEFGGALLRLPLCNVRGGCVVGSTAVRFEPTYCKRRARPT